MIDNDYYNRAADGWWKDNNCPLTLIRYTMNPLRFAYVVKQFVSRSLDCRGKTVLDVGCGGGFLTEEIAKFGLTTTGLDPSAPSLEAARRHAEKANLSINYLEGFGDALPFENGQFDIVFCCDVLEHVKNYRGILAEVSRVLCPGGLFFFETINRTLFSYLVVLFILQEWSLTRVIPPGIHNWKYFIKPPELKRALKKEGLAVQDIQGILPAWNAVHHLFFLKSKIKNDISLHDLCRLFKCHESIYKGLCYIGYAVKDEILGGLYEL